jgi:hypothetical protein
MNFNWKKPGAIETLIDMWKAGERTKDIAKAIGNTSGAKSIAHKAHKLGLGPHPNPRHKLPPDELVRRRREREKRARSLGEGQLSRGQVERTTKHPTTYDQAYPLGEPMTDDWSASRYLSNERN